MEKTRIEKTKKGYPGFWEAGGGYRNTGEACIVAAKDGQPKVAVYVRSRGHLANAHHALIILEVGDYIISASHHRGDFEIYICKVVNFKDAYAILKQVYEFSEGEWNAELPAFLEAAVQAAKEKATCYHCREAHFIRAGR